MLDNLDHRYRRYLVLLVFLAAVAIALYAAQPLWEPRLPHGSDTLSHLYELVQLDHLVRQGVLYSRWMPYKASGFGTPFFHYYAPLAFYAAEGFWLLGAEPVTAMRLALGTALVGAAVGMYLWARDAFDAPAGLVGAAAYVCAPYLLYNAYSCGGFAEHYALMWMPLALLLFAAVTWPSTPPVYADGVIVVDTDDPADVDDGNCSLIEAIIAANTDSAYHGCTIQGTPGDDTINLQPGTSYTLTAVHNSTGGPNGLPAIVSAITIEGQGATIVRSTTAPDFRILYVASSGNLTLKPQNRTLERERIR